MFFWRANNNKMDIWSQNCDITVRAGLWAGLPDQPEKKIILKIKDFITDLMS